MNTKEVIERVKARFDKWALDEEDVKAIQTLIPELSESEDEKIRNEMVDYFKKECECLLNDFRDKEDEKQLSFYNKALGYLEKQKEQKPIDIDFISNWLRKHIRTYLNSEYNEFHKAVEYDGSINIEHLIDDLKKATEQQSFVHKNNFANKFAEWSEEDEKIVKAFVFYLENDEGNFSCNGFTKDEFIHWLKSLPERFNLQAKQEWSEEDEEMLDLVIGDVRDSKQLYPAQSIKDLTDKEIAWLKSLRSSWKPSEEQMDALNYAIAEWDGGKKLESLYTLRNDLKKLM